SDLRSRAGAGQSAHRFRSAIGRNRALHRQRRRSDDRHHQGESRIRERRPSPLAGRVRQRGGDPVGRPRGHRRAVCRRAVERQGTIRIHRQTRQDRGSADGDCRAPQRHGKRHQGWVESGRDDRDRRPAASGAGQPRHHQERQRHPGSKGRVMNISALFIKRPITTTLIILGIMVFGAMSYRILPVADLPTVDYPNIQVNASLPGASPDTVASAVALPLEKQLATIAGLASTNSWSSEGATSITLQFVLSRNIDAAAQDVQSMIARTARQLPAQMPAPPSYSKVNPGDYPVVFLVLRSKTLPLSTVDEYAESTIAQRISMVSGVAQVQVFGGAKYAVRIDLDPRALSAHGIGIDEVASAIQNANVSLPTGTLYGPQSSYVVLANGQILRAAGYAPLVIGFR